MIGAISRLKEIARNNQQALGSMSVNASLPLSFSVTAKLGFNRYELRLGKKTLKTKSAKPLELGGEYWGEASESSNSIIIKNMLKKPNFSPILDDGLALADELLLNGAEAFAKMVKTGLVNAKNSHEFNAFSTMLLALSEGVAHVGFIRDSRVGVLQLFKNSIYVIFDEIGPVRLELSTNTALTPFLSVANALEKSGFTANLSFDITPIWQIKNGLINGVA